MPNGKKPARKKQTSVLTGQRPKKSARRKSRPRPLFLKLAGITVLATGLVLGGIYAVNRLTKLATTTHAPSLTWQISFSPKTDRRLSGSEKEKIAKYLSENAGTGSEATLAPIARHIQKTYAAARVNLLRVEKVELVATVILRTPAMRIRADRERLVTREGSVYGVAQESDASLPLVSGVLSESPKNVEWNDDSSLVLSEDEKKLVLEALELVEDSKTKNIAFSKINFIKYRGFIPEIKDGAVEVALGRAPFSERIGKLDKILLKLKKQGISASRIELDYNGKAFIKERTL